MEINGVFNPLSAKRARDVLGVTSEFGKRSLNVLDFGAKMDGTDDTTAFASARAASGRNGVVEVPSGVLKAGIGTDPNKCVLWRLSGNDFEGGTVPVSGIGSDIVETFLPYNGGKFISQTATTVNSKQLATYQRTVSHSGGGGGVLDTLRINSEITGNPGAYIFGLTSVVNDRATAVNTSGNNVAGYFQYNRWTGGAPGWSAAFETADYTNTTSAQSAPLLGAEILIMCNRADDTNSRVVLDLVAGKALKDSPTEGKFYENFEVYAYARASVVLGDFSQGHAKCGYTVECPITEAAFDTSKASFQGANAIAFRTGQNNKIDLSNNGTKTLMWNAGGALQYQVDGAIRFEVTDGGTVNVTSLRAALYNQSEYDSALPTSKDDARGSVGDVLFSGLKGARKTPQGWATWNLTLLP